MIEATELAKFDFDMKDLVPSPELYVDEKVETEVLEWFPSRKSLASGSQSTELILSWKR